MATQGKRWCFRVSNYSDADVRLFSELVCVYCIFGKEVGELGTPHLQGYAVFAKNYRLAGLKKIHHGSWWGLAKGTTEENITYCSKEGAVHEHGVRPLDKKQVGLAESERWEAARTAAKSGNLDDVPADIYTRYYRTLKEIAKDHMSKPDDLESVCGVWIVGPPGCGKSHYARAEYPDAYLKMQNKWWDGYQSEENVILDDMDSDVLGHHLKIWTDRYSFLAETKGGALHIRPKCFIVTSNYLISDLFKDPVLVSALERRFKIVTMGFDVECIDGRMTKIRKIHHVTNI